jgi:2-C-methyl-D-erythritol 4-phosphate cytidylyltransferase
MDLSVLLNKAREEYVAELRRLIRGGGIKKVDRIVEGGKTRRESVSNGLKHLDPKTSMVVVHDGVRPLITPNLIETAIKAAAKAKAIVVAVPVKPTIKRVDKRSLEIIETLDRSELWEVQTPQVFDRKLLEKAHAQTKASLATDDAMLVEALGQKVKVIEGDYSNIKITTREDLIVAQALLLRQKFKKSAE